MGIDELRRVARMCRSPRRAWMVVLTVLMTFPFAAVDVAMNARPAGAAITSYTTAGTMNPEGITTGPDGALWFVDNSGSFVGRITTGGTITKFTGGNFVSRPIDITAGPDGALWFTDYGQSAIGRMTTSGSLTYYSNAALPGVYDPGGITVGSDGAMWFTDGNSIGRITTSGNITLFTAPGLTSASFGITAGSDGALWFTNDVYEHPSIGRITTSGNITLFPVPDTNGSPIAITTGPDGAMWFTNLDSAYEGEGLTSYGRITSSGAITMYTTPGFSGPFGITAANGALWMADDGSVLRITTNGEATSYDTGLSLTAPWGLTQGPDGALWATDSDPGSIVRFTLPGPVPNTPRAVRIGSGPSNASTGSLTVLYTAGPPSGPTVTAFTATCRSSNGGSTRTGVHHGATAAAIVVTGLRTGRKYQCTVTAKNANGASAQSAASGVVIVGTPGRPGKPAVRRVGAGRLEVSFSKPANNGAAITKYKAACHPSNGGTPKGEAAASGPIVVTGLTHNKKYTCTVTATNSRGSSPASAPSAAATA